MLRYVFRRSGRHRRRRPGSAAPRQRRRTSWKRGADLRRVLSYGKEACRGIASGAWEGSQNPSFLGSSRQRYVTRHRVNGGRFANEGMSDRPFHACFEAKIRSISRLKIKISQTSFRVVLERRGSETRFQGDENSGFHKCFNRLSKILCRDTYLCRDEPVFQTQRERVQFNQQ